MGSSLLTLDLGNSRLKACLWDETACLVARAGFANDDAGLAAFGRWPALAAARPARAALSSVAARERETALSRELARSAPELALELPASGLEVRCEAPELVGRDRLFAARGALQRVEADGAIVVDLGTALTVDAVTRAARGAANGLVGAFLGGAIAPGPELCAAALAQRTARLPRVEPVPSPPALGRSTEQAIAAGVAYGVLGAARELVERVARAAGLERAPVVVTGGASGFLERGAFGARARIDDPDLVHVGLRAALGR